MRVKLALCLSSLAILLAACGGASVATSTKASAGTSKTSTISNTGAPAGSSAATLESSVEDAISKVTPSVVEITVQTSQGQALGSGSIITSDGYILTNYHVIQGGQNLKVTTTQNTYDAQVKGSDPADDLAIIKISDPNPLPTIGFADSTKARIGQFVIAVGNPLGVGQSASFGIISALNRSVSEAPNGPANIIPNAIQTSAPINPGNSGGALIDLSGGLVGIPTLGAIDPEFGNTPANGIGFAIPSSHAKFIADQIIANGKVTDTGRAFIGVQTVDVTPAIASQNGLSIDYGCYIESLVSGAPAASAGLKVGDIIYQIDSTPINDTVSLGTYLAGKNPGDQVSIKVKRGNSDSTVVVKLGTLPAN